MYSYSRAWNFNVFGFREKRLPPQMMVHMYSQKKHLQPNKQFAPESVDVDGAVGKQWKI